MHKSLYKRFRNLFLIIALLLFTHASLKYRETIFKKFFDKSLLLTHPHLLLENAKAYYRFSKNTSAYNFSKEWIKKNSLVAHGLGGIDNTIYSNSMEAFEQNYAKGIRVFEADFIFSTDDHLILTHTRAFIKSNEFLSKKIDYKYTPLDVRAFTKLLEKYPDAIIITDTKQDFTYSIKRLVSDIKSINPDLLSRIVPQIYHPHQLHAAMEIYEFNSMCFTLYRSDLDDTKVLMFLKKHAMPCLVIRENRANTDFLNKLNAENIAVFVHTINDKYTAHKLFSNGVTGVFTDFLSPQDFDSHE